MIEKRYGAQPYGWPELEVALLVARLAVLKEVTLVMNAAPLPIEQAYDYLVTPSKQKKVTIRQRKSVGKELIKKAQSLGKDLFAKQGPGGEDALFAFLMGYLKQWDQTLRRYEPLAKTGDFPGDEEIQTGLLLLGKLIHEKDSVNFLERFLEKKSELLDLCEDYTELQDFYTNQKSTWDRLRNAFRALSQNQLQLNKHAEGGPALSKMGEILAARSPYKLLHQVAGLIQTAEAANEELVAKVRGPVVKEIQLHMQGVTKELDEVTAAETLRIEANSELEKLLYKAETDARIPHIAQAKQAADDAFERALEIIKNAKPAGGDDTDPAPTPRPKPRRVVTPRTFCTSSFLETQAEVEDFLKKLRVALETAIEADERIQIK